MVEKGFGYFYDEQMSLFFCFVLLNFCLALFLFCYHFRKLLLYSLNNEGRLSSCFCCEIFAFLSNYDCDII